MVLIRVKGIDVIAEYLKTRQKRRIKLKDFVRKAGKKYG
jgi:hypothetical protein